MIKTAMARHFTATLLLGALCGEVASAVPIVYPAKGQTAQQQQADQGECHGWAVQNTGIDPARVASSPPPQVSSEPQGERARGAARGALGGAAIGAIAGDAGKGAGVGAVVGTVRGGREARSKQASAQQQANSQQQAQINTYYRAYGACLEGRGYTVK